MIFAIIFPDVQLREVMLNMETNLNANNIVVLATT